MRRNQVTITVERFGNEVPEELNAKSIKIKAYADSNNVYEALAAAFNKVLEEIKDNQKLPEFGCSTSSKSIELND